MAATLRFRPLAIIYADGNAVLSSKGYVNVAQPNASTTLYADTVTRINAAIAEVVLYYQSYGYAAAPNLAALPAVPTGGNALIYQALGTQDAGVTLVPVDGGQTSGGSHPMSALAALIAEPALSNIALARKNLDAGKS